VRVCPRSIARVMQTATLASAIRASFDVGSSHFAKNAGQICPLTYMQIVSQMRQCLAWQGKRFDA
jgi:hypothetical protein